MNNKLLLLSALSYILPINTVLANDSLAGLPEAQRDYVARYVDAVNTDDLSKLKNLTHSNYLKCSNKTNHDYFDRLFQQALNRDIPEAFTVSIEPLSSESITTETEGAQQRGLPYPATPTHVLQIDYAKGEYSFVTIIRNLSYENGRYLEISGCPTDEMVAKFRRLEVKKAEDRRRAKQLFDQLAEPLLSKVTTLLKAGQKIAAWKHYSEVSGESLSTAKAVLSHINTQ